MKFTAQVIDRPNLGLTVSIHIRGPKPDLTEEQLVTEAGIRLRATLPTKDSNLRDRVLHELNWEAKFHWDDPIKLEVTNP